MVVFVLYLFVVLLAGLELYWIIRSLEYICAAVFKRQIPFVASDMKLRMAVVNEIKNNYPEYKTLCEIGAGYGGMARAVARKCNMSVWALENMPFTYAVARVSDIVLCARNVKTLRVDAFKWLMEYDGLFDVGVAYLGPGVNDKLLNYRDKFKTLFVLDVPISDIVPTRVVEIGGGYTRYGRRKYPHRLFVYEFVPNDGVKHT